MVRSYLFFTILFTFITCINCSEKREEQILVLSANREAQIGWVKFDAYSNNTFSYSLSSRDIYKGEYRLKADTLFLTCSDTTIGIDKAIIEGKSLHLPGKERPQYAGITINKIIK